MLQSLYDSGITLSANILIILYILLIISILYIIITNYLFECDKSIMLPRSYFILMLDIWNNILYKSVKNLMLAMIMMFISIIPVSLIWPVGFPLMTYIILKYKNSQQFKDLLSSS